MRRALRAIAVICGAAGLTWEAGASDAAASAMCARAVRSINTLADFTSSDCTPGKDKGGTALIFIATGRVFGDERRKKGYLSVLVGAAGHELNATKSGFVTSVSFMDKDLASRREVFTIPARDVARLQREIKADRVNLDAFYAGILKAGAVRPVQK